MGGRGTILLTGGWLALILGCPGGDAQVQSVAQVIVNVLDGCAAGC